MKTVADFKRKMCVGATVVTTLYYLKNGVYVIAKTYGAREVSIVQTDSFAFKTWDTAKKKYVNIWRDWPKNEAFVPIADNVAEIHFEGGKLIYTFL